MCTARATGSTAARPARWAGRIPAALGVRRPTRHAPVVALSGDYDFQFMIEELAVGAQFKLPYIHMLVNNSYLGLIRQSQRGFDMDYCVQLAFENINADPGDVTAQGYGVDHLKVVKAWVARPSACTGRKRLHRPSPRPRPGWPSSGCRWSSRSSSSGDQHRHGHRDRQRGRVRRTRGWQGRRAHRRVDARLNAGTPCPSLPPT
jgi:hypothetical protein